MSSNVTCLATDAAWAVDAIGQDACQQYAALLGVCDPSFLLTALAPSSPPYLPPSTTTGACACNLVAYNLASACRWCQDTLQPLWWATEAEWKAKCASLGQPFVGGGLPSTIAATNLTFSDWALNVTITNGTWDPNLVSQIAAGGTSSITLLPSGIVEGGHPTPLSSQLPESPPSWGKPSAKDVIGITVGVVILTLFLGFFIGFILCRHRRARKAQRECHNEAGDLPENKEDAESISKLPPPLKYTAS